MRAFSIFALALLLAGRAEAGCLAYGRPVQLDGTLFFREYPGPPNYDDKSQPVTFWFLSPTQPICVDADPDPAARAVNVAVEELREIQVIPPFPPGNGAFRSFRGKQVRLTGVLHGRTGKEQKTPVFLGDARIEQPAKKPGS